MPDRRGKLARSWEPRILRPQTTGKSGYLHVGLRKDGITTSRRIHNMVAEAFLGDSRVVGFDVNHIDGEKHNNRADNLEWCSRSENALHAHRLGLSLNGNRHRNAKLNCGLVGDIRQLKRAGIRKFEVVRLLGVPDSLVGHVWYGKTWNHCHG